SISGQSIALGRHLPTIQQRVPNNNITPLEINHEHISSYHALIEVENGQLVITEQKSTNGTFINGNQQIPYTKTILKHGDHLKLGKVEVEGKIIITATEMIIEIYNTQNQLPIQPPQLPKPQIKINLYDENGDEQNHILTPPIAIGRELNIVKQKVPNNNITPIEIHHSSISGYHAIIDVENGQFVLTDQNSSNGSFVNNVKQNAPTKAILKNGDKLTLGIIESEITINQNEMVIDVNNHPESEPGLKCPNRQCEKTILNKTKNDTCPDCGTFLGMAISIYIPKKH
ncbi:MAG TPA: FHA domain-containing protein, partial [Allocoleopsis sp.]